MYTNSKCVLYLKSLLYKPVIVPECMWTQRSIKSAGKEGMHYTENAFVMFSGLDDLRGMFSKTSGDDFVIEGELALNIDVTSEKGRSEGKKALVEAGAVTIMMADYKNYGSNEMRHWELSCK